MHYSEKNFVREKIQIILAQNQKTPAKISGAFIKNNYNYLIETISIREY